MMDNHAKAIKLKEEGNRYFGLKDYTSAESCYSQAIIHDPTFTALYTNRAIARFSLAAYDAAVADCETAIASDPSSIKAHYYKSKCLLAAKGGDVDAACDHARLAYESCAATDDRSLDMTMAHYLRCRSERWAVRERRRAREAGQLEAEVLRILEEETKREVEAAGEAERGDVESEGDARLQRMRAVFEKARADDDRQREVPEWLVDDISFNVMVDPVVTHTGRSYERASIQAAINNNSIDPVTREPLAKGELVPNIGLRRACEWYLENNGWAYDW